MNIYNFSMQMKPFDLSMFQMHLHL